MTKQSGSGSQVSKTGVFTAPGDPARPTKLRLESLPGGESGERSAPEVPARAAITGARRDLDSSSRGLLQRLRERLLDWGWWPEPLHEHWILVDREMLRRIDRLEDGLMVSLLTSRAVGDGKKQEIRRTHQAIKALRVYRWRQTS